MALMQGPGHYWTDKDAAGCIEHVDKLGPRYSSEEPVWHAWQAICLLYFPKDLLIPGHPSFNGYSTKRELHRGTNDNPGSKIPDVVTCERHEVLQVRALGSNAQTVSQKKRDILWVEVSRKDRKVNQMMLDGLIQDPEGQSRLEGCAFWMGKIDAGSMRKARIGSWHTIPHWIGL